MIAWLLACGAEPAPIPPAADRAAFLEIAALAAPDPDATLPRCAALAHPDLAGECALIVADRASRRDGEPGRWCERVPEGRWRDECAFVAAEHWERGGDVDRAVASCARAGAFADRCVFHLWQRDVLRGQRGLDPTDYAGSVAAGERVYAAWAARIGEGWRAPDDGLPLGVVTDDDTFAGVFWARWFAQLAEHDPNPDPARCAAVARRDACEDGVADVLRRRALDRRGVSGAGGPRPR